MNCNNCNFTYEHFKECMALAKEKGLKFFSMHDFFSQKQDDKFIVIRHDVDLSLPHALSLAKVENSIGINSTYFIRLDGIFNPFSDDNLKIIKKIQDMGHEIGIHYEYYHDSIGEFKDYIKKAKNKFESLGITIHGAALHKAKKLKDSKDRKKLNIIEEFLDELGLEYDSYSRKFMKDMKFISDSKFRWREGCMCMHISALNKLCILTHPIWWSDKTSSLVSIIEEVVMQYKEKKTQ